MLAREGSPKFLTDAMLGSLARKLRVFGFDTTYFDEGTDTQLIERAMIEERVVLTADKALSARGKARNKVTILLIAGRTDSQRLRSLSDQAEKRSLRLKPGESRCALCNGTLVRQGRAEVSSQVPAAVVASHRLYYRCTRCGNVYWKGGHWKRLRRLSKVLLRR